MTEVSLKRILHFKLRLQERHGITLTDVEFKDFCHERKEKGAAVQINCRLGVHKCQFGEAIVAVLWDRKHHVPITAYPVPAVIKGERGHYKWDGERFLITNASPKKRRKYL